MTIPKVSVCLVTYNGAETVERALRSLLAQTSDDYEIVISDDHSTDDTVAICERLTAGHKRVRFIRPERNLGAQRNMEFALSQARGKYFVWACQDDYWEPEFVQKLSSALDDTPSTVAAQGWVRNESEDGNRKKDVRLFGRDLPERQSRLELATSVLTHRSRERDSKIKNSVFMHGMWKKDAFAAAVRAHKKIFTNERQIVCHLALAGEFRYVDELLFKKMFTGVSLKDRSPAMEPTVVAKEKTDRWTELMDTLAGIIRSPIIEPRMKLIAVPTLFAAYSRNRLNVGDLLMGRAIRAAKFLVPRSHQGILKKLYQGLTGDGRPQP